MHVLSNSNNEEIHSHLPELLTWLQDSNWPVSWPVSRPVSERLQTVDVHLAPAITEILKSEDNTWKYFLLSDLLLNCKPEVREFCMDEIVRIANNPSPREKREEVDLVAKDVIAQADSDSSYAALKGCL